MSAGVKKQVNKQTPKDSIKKQILFAFFCVATNQVVVWIVLEF